MSMPRKICCKVTAVSDHGGRVYTVDLEPCSLIPAYRPGQFLHLTVDNYDPSSFWPESRVFSIVSSPQDRKRLRVCFSVVGVYTKRMESLLKVGAEVWVKLPYGEFEIDRNAEAVLLAGGTGISAFMAFLEMLQPANPHPIHLFYGAKSAGLLLFRDIIERQAEIIPGLSVGYFSETTVHHPEAHLPVPSASLPPSWGSDPTVPKRGSGKSSGCSVGRLDLDKIWRDLPNPSAKIFYLSGPPAMLQTLKSGLLQRGIVSERIRMDAWD